MGLSQNPFGTSRIKWTYPQCFSWFLCLHNMRPLKNSNVFFGPCISSGLKQWKVWKASFKKPESDWMNKQSCFIARSHSPPSLKALQLIQAEQKSGEAKRLWAYSSCKGTILLTLCVRGGRKTRTRQRRQAASAPSITECAYSVNIPMCHELFMSPIVCVVSACLCLCKWCPECNKHKVCMIL